MCIHGTFCYILWSSLLGESDGKVKAIRDAPSLRNVTELRSFLGMLAALSNFISKFINSCPSTLRTIGQQAMEVDGKL